MPADLMPLDLSRVLGPTAQARGLPTVCYVSEDYFALERERLFARTWTCVGVGADVPRIGDVRPVKMLGMPLLMARGRDNAVRVFHNVCRHRGAELVDKPGNGPVIRCPYHSWAYDLTGRLVRTPDFGGPGVDEVAGIDKSELGLRPVRSARWLDFVFINLDGKAAPLDDWLRPLKEMWSHYALEQLRHGDVQEYRIRANWKLPTENALEYYHLPWIHPTLDGYSPIQAHYHCNAGNRFVGTATRDYHPSDASGSALPQFPSLTDTQRLVGEYPVVFPNLWLGVQVDHFFAVVVYPKGAALTEQRFHLYFIGDQALDEGYATTRAEIVERWRTINTEDVAIAERLQDGRASPGFDGGALSPVQDFGSHHFMRMVASFVTDSD
ncbi:MAG: aromatic ring-hydroxylating oxygenase subunit alpha [Dongiaceae bacterium]